MADNALADSKANQMKIDALNKIFNNVSIGLGDSLKRWREINQILKLRNQMNDKQKQMCLSVLNGLLNNGIQNKIREAINKFRLNRRIIEIQRNFLKRLLMSKAGLVLIGFKKWVALP